jgi:hypothetical protein
MNAPLSRDAARHRPRARRRGARLLLLLAALPALLAGTPPAHAGGCDGCPGPTIRDLRSNPDFRLPQRSDVFGNTYRDYYETDRGECFATASGTPEVKRLRSWLVLRGSGEIWNCPHSVSEDTITITTQQTDSTEWNWRMKVGAELGVPAAKMKVEVEQGLARGTAITEVTKVTKTMRPGYCRRIPWEGYFEVGEFEATGDFIFQQRWAWWTKNETTGPAVHAKGDVWVNCGTATLILDRKAPISGYFHLSQRGCDDPACVSIVERKLGWFPPLPPHLPDPKLPDPQSPEEENPEPEPEPEPAPPVSPLPDTNPEPEDLPQPDADSPQGDGGTSTPLPDDQPSSSDLGEPPTGPLPDPLEEI